MTLQTPLNSGFGPATTAAQVIAGRDLTGQIAIVTGGYAGIGLETVRALTSARTLGGISDKAGRSPRHRRYPALA
jgi:hypothetical protein